MGFAEVLTIVFAALKLTDHIDWSWFWVFSPMMTFYGIIAIGGCLLYWIMKPKRSKSLSQR